jgi:multiple sugar transport system ATP-binding protein
MTLGQRIGVMKDGRLLQVADAMTLYNQPVNRFVAGFIGSPPMNFLSGRIEPGDPLRFVHPSFTLALPAGINDRLAPAVGRPVVLGVRPENVRIAVAAGIPAVVEVCELMGSEVMLYIRLDEWQLVAKLPPDSARRPGETVNVSFQVEFLHFFDAETEITLV